MQREISNSVMNHKIWIRASHVLGKETSKMKNQKRWIAAALAMGVGFGSTGQAWAAGGLFGNGASKASQTGQVTKPVQKPDHTHDDVQQTVANVGDQTAEGTVISVTPVYKPGEEPGKASFDGTRGDARAQQMNPLNQGLGRPAQVTSEPSPIGVVQTNYSNSAGRPGPNPNMPVDVMAHGRSAGAGMGGMQPGMMPQGQIPQGPTPNMGMKPPRRGLMGLLRPKKSAAQDPLAVFNMSASERSMHAAMPVGPQAGRAPVSSLPPSAVYGQKPGH